MSTIGMQMHHRHYYGHRPGALSAICISIADRALHSRAGYCCRACYYRISLETVTGLPCIDRTRESLNPTGLKTLRLRVVVHASLTTTVQAKQLRITRYSRASVLYLSGAELELSTWE